MKFLIMLFLVSCGSREFTVIEKQGVDGFSLVSETGILAANSACLAGGTVMNLYKDLDRNEIVTHGVDKLETSFIVCNGVKGDTGVSGTDGADGADGIDGEKGDTGLQGLPGATGASGSNGILAVMDIRHGICGLPIATYSDAVIKLVDGRYLSSVTASGKTRFTILIQNVTYTTSDGNTCKFKVDTANNIVRM